MLFWIVQLGDFLLVMLFPIFGFIYEAGELQYLVIIPVFGWTKSKFIFIPIPSIIWFEEWKIYSVVFCYSPKGYFSLFLFLFIRIHDQTNENYTHTIWIIAPLFRYNHDSYNKSTSFFFIPTLTIYIAKENKRLISYAYLLVGYIYDEEIEFIWFLPFFFYYKTKSTVGLLLLVAIFNYHQSIDKKEDEKEIVYSYRSWFLPLYYFSTSKSKEETKSIFVYIFPIFIYKSPGGLLKNLVRGTFKIGGYTITNHLLFLSFNVSSLDPNRELQLILFGLIGSEKLKVKNSIDESPYRPIHYDYVKLEPEDLSDEDIHEGSNLIKKENEFVETTTYWILLMIYSTKKDGNIISKTYYLLPIVYYDKFNGGEQSDIFFLIFLTRFKFGKHRLFTIYGLFYWDHSVLMIFFFYSYAIIKYEYIITRDSQNIQLSKTLFYIYFLIVYEYYESHLKLKGNTSFEKETYPSKLFIAVGWIWQHFGLFSVDYNYIEHDILISCFLIFRYEQDEGYLSYKTEKKRRKMKQVCFLWFFHPYASLIRLDILYENNTYRFIFCLAILLYCKFEEIIKSLVNKTSMISYQISMIAIMFHPDTSLIQISNNVNALQTVYNCSVFPLFGYSKVEAEINSFGGMGVSQEDDKKENSTDENLWILFFLRYKCKDTNTMVALFPIIPFDSNLTFWLTLIRFVNKNELMEFRFLYRLILYQNFKEEDKMNLEINPLMNIEKSSQTREINFIGGIFGYDTKGCKFCCCIHCCSNSRKYE
jgi:hypothetical protein